MKVLHIVRNLDRYSGAAYQALNLARYQNELGLDVTILNVSDNFGQSVKYDNSLRIVTIPKSRNVFSIFALFRNYDIAHFHGMFLLEIMIAKLADCKILLKTTLLGEDDFESIKARPYGKFRLSVLRWSVHVNNALATPIEQINKHYLTNSKVIKVPNFVEVDSNHISCEKENTVVYVGAIIERKRVLDAISFFENNIQKFDYQMLVVGPSDIHETAADSLYVKKFFEKVDSNESVKYLGRVSQVEVLEILSKAKALVFLSDKEGMPNVVLEALASNCFVITSSISGVASDIYSHRKEGFNVELSDDFDINLVEEAVESKLPLKLADEKFSFYNNTQVYTRIYQEL